MATGRRAKGRVRTLRVPAAESLSCSRDSAFSRQHRVELVPPTCSRTHMCGAPEPVSPAGLALAPLPRHPIAVSSSRPNPTPVLSPPFHLRVCARRNASRFSVPLKLLELAEVPRGLESGLQSPKAYCYFRRRTRNGSENPKCQQRRRRAALLHLLAQRARWRHRWTCSTRPS